MERRTKSLSYNKRTSRSMRKNHLRDGSRVQRLRAVPGHQRRRPPLRGATEEECSNLHSPTASPCLMVQEVDRMFKLMYNFDNYPFSFFMPSETLNQILPVISDLNLDDLETLGNKIEELILARRQAAYEAFVQTKKPALLARMGQVDRLVERSQDITSPNSAMIHVSNPRLKEGELASSRKYDVLIVLYTDRSQGDRDRALQSRYVPGSHHFQVSLNPGDQKVFDFPVPWNEMPEIFQDEISLQARSLPQDPRS